MGTDNAPKVVPETATETAPEITEDLAREAKIIVDSFPGLKQGASSREKINQGRKILAALRKKYPWITRANYQRLLTAINGIKRLDEIQNK